MVITRSGATERAVRFAGPGTRQRPVAHRPAGQTPRCGKQALGPTRLHSRAQTRPRGDQRGVCRRPCIGRPQRATSRCPVPATTISRARQCDSAPPWRTWRTSVEHLRGAPSWRTSVRTFVAHRPMGHRRPPRFRARFSSISRKPSKPCKPCKPFKPFVLQPSSPPALQAFQRQRQSPLRFVATSVRYAFNAGMMPASMPIAIMPIGVSHSAASARQTSSTTPVWPRTTK